MHICFSDWPPAAGNAGRAAAGDEEHPHHVRRDAGHQGDLLSPCPHLRRHCSALVALHVTHGLLFRCPHAQHPFAKLRLILIIAGTGHSLTPDSWVQRLRLFMSHELLLHPPGSRDPDRIPGAPGQAAQVYDRGRDRGHDRLRVQGQPEDDLDEVRCKQLGQRIDRFTVALSSKRQISR